MIVGFNFKFIVLFFDSTVQDVDLFAGGTAENSVKNGTVGETFGCIIAYQFRDFRNGDRFWHENPPPIGIFSKGKFEFL